MQLHIFRYPELGEHGASFGQYLELRKQVLVDELGWQIVNDGQFELDQYDNLFAVYSIVSHRGRVVAGARALPCNASFYGWSYMLRDAHLGHIGEIPNDLLSDYPTDATTLECTRLVSSLSDLESEAQKIAIKLVVHGLCVVGEKIGAGRLISLSPVVFGRRLRTLGYDAKPLGKPYRGVEDGRGYRAFEMPCDPEVNQDVGRQFTVSKGFGSNLASEFADASNVLKKGACYGSQFSSQVF